MHGGLKRSLNARLLAGILIIAVSIAGAVGLALAMDRTVTAWVAPHDLVPGDVIALRDLQPQRVRLDLVERGYLIGDIDTNASVVAVRTVGAGEIVPLAAIADRASQDSAVVVVPVRGPIATGLTPGATAQIWVSASPSRGAGAPALASTPTIIVDRAVVGRQLRDTGLFGGDTTAIEVVVPRERLAVLLAALTDGATISLIAAAVRQPEATTTGAGRD